jgi:hypothetical protein
VHWGVKIKRIVLLIIVVFFVGCMNYGDHDMDHGDHDVDHGDHDVDHGSAGNPLWGELEIKGDGLVAGDEATLVFHLKDHHEEPVGNLMTHHGRTVHVLVIGEDLGTFGHIHPEDFGEITSAMKQDGIYSVKYTFPKGGKYLVGLDVMTMESALSKQFTVEVAGNDSLQKFEKDMRRVKYFEGLTEQGDDVFVDPYFLSELEVSAGEGIKVSFNAPESIVAGEEFMIRYEFEKDGEAVTDFEPYLDAPMHIAFVRAGFNGFLHTHGGPPGMSHQDGQDDKTLKLFGPDLEATITLPRAGLYQVFGQVKREGKITMTAFMIEVEEGHD